MCFWSFANEITDVGEAKRFYSLFGVAANFSGVAAGQVSIFLMNGMLCRVLPFGQDSWHRSLILLSTLVVIVGLGTMAVVIL